MKKQIIQLLLTIVLLILLPSTTLSQDLIIKIDTTKEINFKTLDFNRITLSSKDRVQKTTHSYYKYAISSPWLKAVEDEIEIGDFYRWAALNESKMRLKEQKAHSASIEQFAIKLEEAQICKKELYETEDLLLKKEEENQELQKKLNKRKKDKWIYVALGAAATLIITK